MRTLKRSTDERVADLKQSNLFSALPEPALKALAMRALARRYETGEYAFHQDAPAEGFHLVIRGVLKARRHGADGRELTLHLIGPGELCGEVPMFEGGTYPASALAEGEVETLFITRAKFLEIGKQNPEVLMKILGLLSRRLRKFVNLLDDLALKEVSSRLAKRLCDLRTRAHSDTFDLDSSKAVLATRLGATAETLSRTFAKMKKRGIIDVQGKTMTIQDPEALSALAEGEKL